MPSCKVHAKLRDIMTTSCLFSILLSGDHRYQGKHLVALSACSLLLHASRGPLAAEDGTCSPDCSIFQVWTVEALPAEILDSLDSATGIAGHGYLG